MSSTSMRIIPSLRCSQPSESFDGPGLAWPPPEELPAAPSPFDLFVLESPGVSCRGRVMMHLSYGFLRYFLKLSCKRLSQPRWTRDRPIDLCLRHRQLSRVCLDTQRFKVRRQASTNLLLTIRPHLLPERVLDVGAHGVCLSRCQELHRNCERFVCWRRCTSFQLQDVRVLEAQYHYA